MADHHLNTFNNFLLHDIHSIISAEMPIVIETDNFKLVVNYTNVGFLLPNRVRNGLNVPLFPGEARLRDLSYLVDIFCDVTEEFWKDGAIFKTNTLKSVILCSLPCLIKSAACHLSYMSDDDAQKIMKEPKTIGGYFIIRGKERVLVSQLRMAYNSPVIVCGDDGIWTLDVRNYNPTNMHTAMIKISLDEQAMKRAESFLSLSCSFLSKKIPIEYIMVLLGVNYEDVVKFFPNKTKTHSRFLRRMKEKLMGEAALTSEMVYKNLNDSIKTQMTKTSINMMIYQILNSEIFPHMVANSSNIDRAINLCYLLDQLLTCYDKNYIPWRFERDYIGNKRAEPAGILMGDLFRQMFKKYCNLLQRNAEKKMYAFSAVNFTQKNALITRKFECCFTNAFWGAQPNSYVRQGVSQILNPINYPGFLSHIQKLHIPICKDTKNLQVRQVHPSSMYFICPLESPEGVSIGLVLNFTHRANVSSKYNPRLLTNLFNQIIDGYGLQGCGNDIGVLINGVVIRFVSEKGAAKLIRQFLSLRQVSIIPNTITWFFDRPYLYFWADEGRFLHQIPSGLYVDPLELQMLKPEERGRPHDILGTIANMIVNVNHSPAPRGCYGAGMIKQGIGHLFDNAIFRTDTTSHILGYPQRQLVDTEIARNYHMEENPFGCNVTIAIASYTGFNQEDACILNKAAIERGLFVSYKLSCISEEEGMRVKIKKPDPSLWKPGCNYDHLMENGLPCVGQILDEKTAVIGAVFFTETEPRDCSIFEKNSGPRFIVHAVHNLKTDNNVRLVKVIIRQIMIPEIGDKFSSTISQKGICGVILPPEDMPFEGETGITPDIIINPHAIPSRMTITQLIETVLARRAADTGVVQDGTSFTMTEESLKSIVDSAQDALLYNGYTGLKFKARTFMGLCYYLKLKHMVSQKIHARDDGPVTSLTRSAPEGRRRDGGLRLGEMELSACFAHGCTTMIQERFFKFTDDYHTGLCTKCGEFVYGNSCNICFSEAINVNLPYIFKLIKQELAGLNMKMNCAITY